MGSESGPIKSLTPARPQINQSNKADEDMNCDVDLVESPYTKIPKHSYYNDYIDATSDSDAELLIIDQAISCERNISSGKTSPLVIDESCGGDDVLNIPTGSCTSNIKQRSSNKKFFRKKTVALRQLHVLSIAEVSPPPGSTSTRPRKRRKSTKKSLVEKIKLLQRESRH